jgi:hypothetical protein
MNREFILNKSLIIVIMHMNETTALFRAMNSTDDVPTVVFRLPVYDYG